MQRLVSKLAALVAGRRRPATRPVELHIVEPARPVLRRIGPAGREGG